MFLASSHVTSAVVVIVLRVVQEHRDGALDPAFKALADSQGSRLLHEPRPCRMILEVANRDPRPTDQ